MNRTGRREFLQWSSSAVLAIKHQCHCGIESEERGDPSIPMEEESGLQRNGNRV